jgi:hypothetical protein
MKNWKHCNFIGILTILAVTIALVACDPDSGSTHTHEFGTVWKSDTTQHWHECSCGEKSDIANHTWGQWTETTAPTLTEEGEEARTCSDCGETQTRSISKLLSPTYDSVTISLSTKKIETVPSENGNITLYGSGAQFTATVNGNNNPIQTVTWSITENVDTETTIANGVLNVAIADHGKTLTIKAISTVDISIYTTKTITVVNKLPSDFYGVWEDNIVLTSISENNFRYENTLFEVYLDCTING